MSILMLNYVSLTSPESARFSSLISASVESHTIYRLVFTIWTEKNHKNENSTRFLKDICKKKHTMRISKMRSSK